MEVTFDLPSGVISISECTCSDFQKITSSLIDLCIAIKTYSKD